MKLFLILLIVSAIKIEFAEPSIFIKEKDKNYYSGQDVVRNSFNPNPTNLKVLKMYSSVGYRQKENVTNTIWN